MTRKIVCILAIFGALTASVQAQESVSKPTKADVVKVVKIISSDKTKIGTYCKLADLGDEINEARSAKDNSKVERLSKQADDLTKTLGPEFIRLNAGLEDVDLQSKEGQAVSAEFDKLDKLCPAK
jgi:parvulin-like peptidyl-prolyl isomerase